MKLLEYQKLFDLLLNELSEIMEEMEDSPEIKSKKINNLAVRAGKIYSKNAFYEEEHYQSKIDIFLYFDGILKEKIRILKHPEQQAEHPYANKNKIPYSSGFFSEWQNESEPLLQKESNNSGLFKRISATFKKR